MSNFLLLSRGPSLPLEPDGVIEDVVIRTPTEAGYIHTRPRYTRARLMWGVNYSVLSEADVAIIKNWEIVTIRNGSDSFSWDHPVSLTVYTVRLTGPVKYDRTAFPTLSRVSFTIQQV